MAMTVTYPVTPFVWVFNENYINIQGATDYDTLDVVVANNTIEVALYGGAAKVYISRLLQLCFTSPETERVKTIHVQVKTHVAPTEEEEEILEVSPGGGYVGQNNYFDDEEEEEQPIVLSEADLTAVWGALEMGDRFSSYGAFCYDNGRVWQRRDVQMFVKFPFNLNLLIANGTALHRRTNRTPYAQIGTTYASKQMETISSSAILSGLSNYNGRTVVYRQELLGLNEGGVFDTSFDYTFHTPADTTVITHVHLRQEQEGYYLRWIDRFGFIEYYLFDMGTLEYKTDPSEYGVSAEKTVRGFNFANYNRRIGVKTERSLKACASNLDKATLEYVESIVSSPIVDLYMGKTKEGTELWQPVHIEGGTYSYNTHHLSLCDFEITIILPNRKTQSL